VIALVLSGTLALADPVVVGVFPLALLLVAGSAIS
jgi:hypothetical protein